jgi:hypothetical protein
MLGHIEKTVLISCLASCLVVSACTTPISPSTSPTPTNIPTANKERTPPSLLYIADNQLYERQPGGTTPIIAKVGEEGDILDAVRVKDIVFVLRGKGLQRIDMKTGKTKMAVEFDKTPLWGELDRTSDDNVLLYSIARDSACSSTGIGATVGLYQVDNDTFKDVFVKDEGYIRPLGLTTDGQNIYGLPVGCDPEFDRFWLISIAQGKIAKELQTWDATSKEYGEGYAALSPDAHFLAFATAYYVESEGLLRYRLSVYDLESLTIERYELPKPPSYSDGLVWSPTSQKLYFILNPGAPYDESSETYGLWSFDIRTGVFSPVTSLDNRFIHIVTISSDGQWILLQPEVAQSVTYVYLPTGEQFLIKLPSEGVSQIVR